MSFAKKTVIIEGELVHRNKGVLQGAPISGLLCNIYLHSLDMKLEEQNFPFLRYADDIVVFADSSSEATKRSEHIISYIENKLKLKINKQKNGF